MDILVKIGKAVKYESTDSKNNIVLYIGSRQDYHTITLCWAGKETGLFAHYSDTHVLYTELNSGMVYLISIEEMIKMINEFRSRINMLETFA